MKKKRVKLYLYDNLGLHVSYYRLLLSVVEDKFYIVEDNWDLIIVSERDYERFRLQYPNDKILVFSTEPFVGDFVHIYSIIDMICRKFKLYNTFLKPFLFKFTIRRNPWRRLLKRLSDKNTYFILTDNIKQDNILCFPNFFQHYYDCPNRFINKQDNIFEKKQKFCAIVNSHFVVDRERFVHKLSKYKQVDSYSGHFKNADFPKEIEQRHKVNQNKTHVNEHFEYDYASMNQDLFKTYKFVICFENSYADDYITDKLPNVMLGESVGVYRGAGNIGEFFNTKSFINYDDYGSDEAVIKRIVELDNDDEKYKAMLNEPFFKGGIEPRRYKNAKRDLEGFIDKVLEA